MKKKNKKYTRALFFLLLLTLVWGTAFPVSAAARQHKNWYKDVVKKVDAVYKVKDRWGVPHKVSLGKYKYYRLLDINGDGTKELLMSNTKKSTYESVVILGYVKGKIKPLLYLSNLGLSKSHLSYKKNILCESSHSPDVEFVGEDIYRFYRLKKGRLKLIAEFEYYHGTSNKDGSIVDDYYVNGKESSREKYQKGLEKYKDYDIRKNWISFSPIAVNRNKVIKMLKGTWYTVGGWTEKGPRFTVQIHKNYFAFTSADGIHHREKILAVTRTAGGYWLKLKGTHGNYYFQYKLKQQHPPMLNCFSIKAPEGYSGTSSLYRELR